MLMIGKANLVLIIFCLHQYRVLLTRSKIILTDGTRKKINNFNNAFHKICSGIELGINR